MKTLLRKLRNNLFSARAVGALGWMRYLQYLGLFLLHSPGILRHRRMQCMDRSSGRRISRFRYRGHTIRFDCRFGDRQIDDGQIERAAYSFGYVREVFLRDCYFRHHPDSVWEDSRIVLDLGVNAGVFSALMTPVAEFIVGVEVNAGLIPVAEHNLRLNHFQDYALECGFIGHGGHFDSGADRYLTIDGLIERYGLDRIDLLKADVEGSEYSLFESTDWLRRVGAISMEVHAGYPGRGRMVAAIRDSGFELAFANQDLERVPRAEDAEFLYAWRRQ